MRDKINVNQLQLFFFFPKLDCRFFTSSVNRANHFFFLFPSSGLRALSLICKRELFFGPSQLVESTAIDLTGYENHNASFFVKSPNQLVSYSFFFFYLKKRLTFFFVNTVDLVSIDSIFLNANWLERELSEMYGVFYCKKLDQRNLLLDYTFLDSPMRKSFPSVGYEELSYSLITESCEYLPINAVEL